MSRPPDGHTGEPCSAGLSTACPPLPASFPHVQLQVMLALAPLRTGPLSALNGQCAVHPRECPAGRIFSPSPRIFSSLCSPVSLLEASLVLDLV